MSLIFKNKFIFRFFRVSKSKFIEIKLFLFSLIYFFVNSRRFDYGWYEINRKFIIKENIYVNEHFKNINESLKPNIKLYNFLGRTNNITNYVYGFHPEMNIKIFPNSKIITRKFHKPQLASDYSDRRSSMQKYIPGPKFKIKNDFEYDEEILSGKSFQISEDNKVFLILLDQYRKLSVNLNYLNEKIKNLDSLRSVTRLYEKTIMNRLSINPKLLIRLITNPLYVISKGSDLAGPNLIYSDNKIISLDWEPRELQHRVFWSDISNLILNVDPAGFFLGKYNNFLKEFFNSIDDMVLNDDNKLSNTIVAASIFWNLPNLHFIDFESINLNQLDSIIKNISIDDLERAAITSEILFNKNAASK